MNILCTPSCYFRLFSFYFSKKCVLFYWLVIIIFIFELESAGQNIRKLVKDGFIIRKPTKIHSRSRARRMKEAKRKGRHSGYGVFSWFTFWLWDLLDLIFLYTLRFTAEYVGLITLLHAYTLSTMLKSEYILDYSWFWR